MSSEEKNTESSLRVSNQLDWFLQSLVKLANGIPALEIGITLQVSGMLVSGSLVSGARYFEGFSEEFSSAFTDDGIADSIKDSYNKFSELYPSGEDKNISSPPPQFIHLKNARFFNTAGSPIPTNRGVWWRGRVSEVGGFSIGSLSAPDINSL